MRRLFAIVLTGAVGLATGCGSSEDLGSAAESTTAQGTTISKPKERAPAMAAFDWTRLERAAGNESGRLIIPSGPLPKKLVVRELRAGKGRLLEPKHLVWFRYVALNFATGEVSHQAWRPPFNASYRNGELADAVEIGMQGMRVGGVRELIAPSRLVYGGAPLVYLIKLIRVGKKGWE